MLMAPMKLARVSSALMLLAAIASRGLFAQHVPASADSMRLRGVELRYILPEPVPGVGIAIPIFYPPLITAAVALIISRRHAAPLAYVSGSLGTLIGADLLNLPLVRQMEAPVMSIGSVKPADWPARNWTGEPTSSRWALCCTRWQPVGRRSQAAAQP